MSSFDQFMTHTLEVSDPSGDVLLRLKRPKKIVKSSMIVSDADENEVARITKTFEGIMRTAFTTADNYVVQIHQDIPEPLHSLVVASALTVDTALKQDDRGFN